MDRETLKIWSKLGPIKKGRTEKISLHKINAFYNYGKVV